MTYAQTNLQLYNQMRLAGYGDASLRTVYSGYDLATRLFTGKFRGSGKPLLSHLVGTASVLCALNAPDKAVAAAVLHAAYIFGEFGDGRPGMTPFRRARVRQAVGHEVEDLIARYHQLEWRRPTMEALCARVETLSPGEREIVLVRLANELEDYLDLGILYCRNAAHRVGEVQGWLGRVCIELAGGIGEPRLAEELKRVFEEVMAANVSDALRQRLDYTYMLAPASSMPKPGVWMRHVLDNHPRLALLLHPARLFGIRSAVGR